MRNCGDCAKGCKMSCCTVMGVEEIDKKAGEPCPKQNPDGTCSIYSDRPASCREWECLWLRSEGLIRNMDRPDRVGLILDVTNPPDGAPQALVAREARPGAFNEESAKKLLERFQKKTLVILVHPDKRTLTGPPELVRQVKAVMEAKTRKA